MNRKVLGVIASAVLAVLGAFLVLSYVNNADERAAAGEERVEVLVVSDSVTAGEKADDLAAKVEPVLVPANVQADYAVASLTELEDQVAAVDLVPGEQLLSTRFVTEEALAEEVGLEIPEGLLQVTVSLSPERAVGGQLLPGDFVAFVASFDPFSLGAVEPGDIPLDQLIGLLVGDEDEEESNAPDSSLQTPNSSHVILHKILVTAVQIERLPAQTDREDAQEVGVELAPTGNLLITLGVSAADLEKIVFSAEHGSVWLADEPETASETGTIIQTRGTIYR